MSDPLHRSGLNHEPRGISGAGPSEDLKTTPRKLCRGEDNGIRRRVIEERGETVNEAVLDRNFNPALKGWTVNISGNGSA